MWHSRTSEAKGKPLSNNWYFLVLFTTVFQGAEVGGLLAYLALGRAFLL